MKDHFGGEGIGSIGLGSMYGRPLGDSRSQTCESPLGDKVAGALPGAIPVCAGSGSGGAP